MKKLWFFVALSVVSTSASATDRFQPSTNPNQAYDKVYPYYIQACAMSQMQKHNEEAGGVAGHAALYLKGACRDSLSEYPAIKTDCGFTAEQLLNENAGVGLSVNKMFANVNWVAVPYKTLFFKGDVPNETELTQATLDQLTDRLVRMKTHTGIILKKNYMNEFDALWAGIVKERGYHARKVSTEVREEERLAELQKFVIRGSMSTDFALNFGRHVYCVKVPVTKKQLQASVNYLNTLNKPHFDSYKTAALKMNVSNRYVEFENEYNWSGFQNNCTHPTYNALAAIGMVPFVKVDQFETFNPVSGVANMLVPADAMLDVFDRVYSKELSPRYLEDSTQGRLAFWNDGFMTQQHGVMTERFAQKTKNSYYVVREAGAWLAADAAFNYVTQRADSIDRALIPDFVEKAVKATKDRSRAERYLTRAEYTNVAENLRYWENLYSNYLAKNRKQYPTKMDEREVRYFETVQYKRAEARNLLRQLMAP